MILWFVDRFGIPGNYHNIWLRLCVNAGVQPKDVRLVSLHKEMFGRQLLTKFGTRKAPTWIPEMQPGIQSHIDGLKNQFRPKAVVLAAPEALCVLGLSQEVATLHNLRGSVYWLDNVPHIVMLPISTWTSLVSQKDIGAANYGFESAEKMETTFSKESKHENDRRQIGTSPLLERRGQVHAEGRLRSNPGPNGQAPSQRGSGTFGSAKGIATTQGRSPTAGSHQQYTIGGSVDNNRNGRNFIDLRPSIHNESAGGIGGADQHNSRVERVHGDHTDSRFDSISTDQSIPRELHVGNGSENSDRFDGGDEANGVTTSDVDRRADDDSVSDDSESDGADGESVDGEVITESDLDDDDEQDRFFYEPVLSPVGRFTLTADVGKLGRILKDGKEANGPTRPYELRY